MIYDYPALKIKYEGFANIPQKINAEMKKGHLCRIKRGLYSDNLPFDAPIISNVCYEPSYISFEYALSFYGLIPEHVSMFTAATYKKKNSKIYRADGCVFEYRSIPAAAFPYGISYLKSQNGINYKIASKEKSLCDTLYAKYPVRSSRDLEILLYNDLRIDEEELRKLDKAFIKEIVPLYHSSTLNMLLKYLEKKDESD